MQIYFVYPKEKYAGQELKPVIVFAYGRTSGLS